MVNSTIWSATNEDRFGSNSHDLTVSLQIRIHISGYPRPYIRCAELSLSRPSERDRTWEGERGSKWERERDRKWEGESDRTWEGERDRALSRARKKHTERNSGEKREREECHYWHVFENWTWRLRLVEISWKMLDFPETPTVISIPRASNWNKRPEYGNWPEH